MNEKLLNLPPVSEMMRDAGLEPKKQLGQNFLFDLNLTRKIARSVPGLENSVVLEVGPGPGGLTRALLECGAKKVIAVEKDSAALPVLEKIKDVADGRLDVILGDALKINLDGHYAVCSNLPYNVGTELLVRWLYQIADPVRKGHISSLTLMFQREVAERIVAKVGDKQYGRLGVLTSLVANAKILFNVPNTAFSPPPKVQSAIVQIIPKENIDIDVNKVGEMTAKLFGQRRKMIRSIIPNSDWTQFGLAGTERAEEIPPEKFAEMID